MKVSIKKKKSANYKQRENKEFSGRRFELNILIVPVVMRLS